MKNPKAWPVLPLRFCSNVATENLGASFWFTYAAYAHPNVHFGMHRDCQ